MDCLSLTNIFIFFAADIYGMSQRAADAVFQGLFALTDIRSILRITAPSHQLDDDQKKKAEKALASVEKQIAILREELL